MPGHLLRGRGTVKTTWKDQLHRETGLHATPPHTHTHNPDLGFLGADIQALKRCEGRESQPWCFPKCTYSVHFEVPFVMGEGRT